MVHYIENEKIRIGVKTEGAELTSFISKETGIEYLWQGNPDVWYGQSPVLFPNIGCMLDDKYYLNGKEYSMPKHGLFRKRTAQFVSDSDNKLVFVEKADDETRKIYPYDFEVYVIFELIEKSLKVTHKVINNSDNTMYFSIGGHPGFNCEIGDYLLFEKNETLDTIEIDTECLRTGKTIPFLNQSNRIEITKNVFDNDALIFTDIKSSYITLASDKHERKVKFDFSDCSYLGIWAKPGAPYVCIEPWWGVNDSHERKADISQKDAIIPLESGNTYSCYWCAEISE
ncbi:MAG: aldose 1-epimerase family protein [Clostridia bacterium]|nr:aldose 1-epimerase family protein [Clostridia bacterium]